MRAQPSKGTSGENTRVPSPDPMPGIDEQPIEPGGISGAQIPDKDGKPKPVQVNRELAEKGILPDPDPDDPISP